MVEIKRDLNRTQWAQIARECPIQTQVAQVTDEDFVDSLDSSGHPCRRAVYKYQEGQLTTREEQWGWRFFHPGFKTGTFFIHALRCDETPRYSSISIYEIADKNSSV